MSIKLPEPYTPVNPYCIICGDPLDGLATCLGICQNKIDNLRALIKERIESERSGVKQDKVKTIADFNRIQDILG